MAKINKNIKGWSDWILKNQTYSALKRYAEIKWTGKFKRKRESRKIYYRKF